MKKIMILVLAVMFMFSTMAFAGGDRNCSSKGQGNTGTIAGGTATQTRIPNP